MCALSARSYRVHRNGSSFDQCFVHNGTVMTETRVKTSSAHLRTYLHFLRRTRNAVNSTRARVVVPCADLRETPLKSVL